VLADELPAGLTPTAAAGTGWTCAISGSRVTCERPDSLQPGTSWPTIQITVNVSSSASNVVNTANLSGGGDTTPTDNVADDPTIVVAAAPDLRISKRHQDPFSSGQAGATYLIVVSNAGSRETTGDVTVTDNVPAGMTPTAASGSGWQCTMAGQTITCQRSDPLAPGRAFPDILLLVNVSPSASSVANLASVRGGGDTTPDDDTATDFTNINVSVDAAISLRLTSDVVVGSIAEYLSQVTNLGPGTIGGDTLVTAELPDVLIPIAAEGSGWRCQRNGQRFICTQSTPFAPGSRLPDLRLRALVAAGSGEATTSAVVVAPGDSNDANDHAAVTTSTQSPFGRAPRHQTSGHGSCHRRGLAVLSRAGRQHRRFACDRYGRPRRAPAWLQVRRDDERSAIDPAIAATAGGGRQCGSRPAGVADRHAVARRVRQRHLPGCRGSERPERAAGQSRNRRGSRCHWCSGDGRSGDRHGRSVG
jgi:uncharacterized repeat protein (TIGR01451 family)